MLTSAATVALVSSTLRARGYKWDWAVVGVLCLFVYLYVVIVTCVVSVPMLLHLCPICSCRSGSPGDAWGVQPLLEPTAKAAQIGQQQ